MAMVREVWWPNMHAAVLAFQCPTCARQRADRRAPVGRLHTAGASVPGELLSADDVPMPKVDNFVGFVIVQDKFSGFVTAVPYKRKDAVTMARTVCAAMQNAVLLPQTLLVDRGSQLNAAEFFAAMRARGVEVKPVFAEHQQANFVERSVGYVKSVLRTSLEGLPRKAWLMALPDVVRAVNSHLNAAKGASAFEILTGVAPPTGFPSFTVADPVWLQRVFKDRGGLWEHVRKQMEHAALQQEERFDKSLGPVRKVAVGDVVLVRTRGDREFNLEAVYERNPWIVTDVLSDVSLRIRSWEKPSNVQEVHIDQTRPAVLEEVDPRMAAGVDQQPQYVVESILDHKGSGDARQYKVRWGGYKNLKQDTWESGEMLVENAGELVSRYERLCGVGMVAPVM